MDEKRNLKSLIFYEDEQLLLINKPAGLIVNEATSHQQESLQTLLGEYLAKLKLPEKENVPLPENFQPQYGSIEEIWQQRKGMVHRLDKNTSGVLLWAKTPRTLIFLLAAFAQRQVEKTYLCLTHGLFGQEKNGRVSLPLARKLKNRQLMAVSAGGREAITLYQVEQAWSTFSYQALLEQKKDGVLPSKKQIEKIYQGFSLVKVRPQTGRTHQIRAHFTHLHHPLVGDQAYLSNKKWQLDQIWCPRQFLHASELTFPNPTHPEQNLTFSVPLPADLETALTFLL